MRLERLDAYRRHLRSAERKRPIDDPALAPMFDRLGRNIRRHKLPVGLFRDLLDAFSQDVRKTRYADFAELADYCRRSASWSSANSGCANQGWWGESDSQVKGPS